MQSHYSNDLIWMQICKEAYGPDKHLSGMNKAQIVLSRTMN